MRPSIGYQNGHHYMARLFARNGQLDAAITLKHCGSHSSAGATIPPWELAATAAEFRRAAMEARAVRPAVPARAPADAVYWEHSVACPAALRPESPAPRYPSIPLRERRPYQVLAQFVVNTDGRVDTVDISCSELHRCALCGAGARRHHEVAFRSGDTGRAEPSASSCTCRSASILRSSTSRAKRRVDRAPSAAPWSGLSPPERHSPQDWTEFLSQVAHALGGSGLPTALRGRRVRFVYSRSRTRQSSARALRFRDTPRPVVRTGNRVDADDALWPAAQQSGTMSSSSRSSSIDRAPIRSRSPLGSAW